MTYKLLHLDLDVSNVLVYCIISESANWHLNDHLQERKSCL